MTDIQQDQYRDLDRSVKRNDYTGAAVRVLVPRWSGDYQPVLMPYDLPPDPVSRDAYLRASVRQEALWAAAVYTAQTKIASMSYDVESDIPLRAKRGQELLLNADSGALDGGGWVKFAGRVTRDYLTQDNGAFIEIERFGGAQGARIKALHHLDSARCRRTDDPERPVIYTDLKGVEHVMPWWSVIMLVDMPDPAADKYGMGMCAAHRAWRKITHLAAIERYVWEKVSGSSPTKLSFVQGLLDQTVKDVVNAAREDKIQRGIINYMGAVVGAIPGDSPLTLVEIALKDLPDGFDPEQERQETTLVYANCIGIDSQDLRPLTGQALGTGAQSAVLDDKQQGKGLAALRKDLGHQLNLKVFDSLTTFVVVERDLRDEKQEADIATARAGFVTTLTGGGVISPVQGVQVLVDDGHLPKEFLSQDQTANTNLGDEEKPQEAADNQAQQVAQEQQNQIQQAPPQQQQAKAKRITSDIVDRILADAEFQARALEIAEEAQEDSS